MMRGGKRPRERENHAAAFFSRRVKVKADTASTASPHTCGYMEVRAVCSKAKLPIKRGRLPPLLFLDQQAQDS